MNVTIPKRRVAEELIKHQFGLEVKLKAINPTPHLCRQRVKQTALEIASQVRAANKFRRVGLSFVQRIEARTRAAIADEVRRHPSTGRTLK